MSAEFFKILYQKILLEKQLTSAKDAYEWWNDP